jgi:hypothetical protein
MTQSRDFIFNRVISFLFVSFEPVLMGQTTHFGIKYKELLLSHEVALCCSMGKRITTILKTQLRSSGC